MSDPAFVLIMAAILIVMAFAGSNYDLQIPAVGLVLMRHKPSANARKD